MKGSATCSSYTTTTQCGKGHCFWNSSANPQCEARADVAGASTHLSDTNSHVDSATRVQGPGVGDLGCPCNTDVWWLHLPKCGTSFGVFAAHTCKEYTKEPRKKYHTPVKADASNEFLGKLVGMFRQPEQRLASELGDLSRYTCDYVEGCNETSALCEKDRCYPPNSLVSCDEDCAGLWGLSRHVSYLINAVHHRRTPANDDFMGVAMQGCQTNMLSGRTCYTDSPPNATHVEMAVQRVKKMLFVGLQEEWFLSMCLFNRIVTGKLFVQPFELQNSRPTNGRGSSSSYDTTGWPKDRHDGAVYAAAKARFWSDVKKYGITEQACNVSSACA